MRQNDVSQKQNLLVEQDGEKKRGIETRKNKEPMKLVVAFVARGYSADVVEAAREAGNEGACILEGRGLGKTEKKFFGLRLEPETEMVMIAVPERLSVKVSKAIYAKCSFSSPARGMVLVLPVSSYYL